MSFNTLKIPLPYVLFFAGLVPWIILASLFSFYEPIGHMDPLIIFAVIIALFVPPLCFIGGIITARQFTGKHRRIGLALNCLGLAVLLTWVVYGWLTN